MENFKTLIDILLMVGAGGGAWFLMRYQVKQLLLTQSEIVKKMEAISEKMISTEQDLFSLKTEAKDFKTFKERITILEQKTSHHIDLLSAENRFVTRREFELTIENLKKTLEFIRNNQEEILKILKNDSRNK